ncbi:MAG: FIG00471280: hypothetical protein [uncultured Sulfurovum sp.]|uniref:Cas10/Cmr2 second palm domain-containing protein n=1 Tax=uncultured Sulfurovum sp. TaxID=269237 RepID=A0A6S6S322_9BACT|nr:MAG: FIG00471280: hypothetical protein [uncultured Sulfurovum sp.]
MAYLYGASIQGIQGFIFETNKLKEIVGASDIIEGICSLEFLNKFCRDDTCIKIDVNNVLRNAGGNIRIKFDDETTAKKFTREFPKMIMQGAYGIVISQAIITYNDDDNNYLDKVDELEQKLKAARNKMNYPLDAKLALVKQAPRTGKPAFEKKVKEFYDKASWQKLGSDASGWLEMLLDKMGQKGRKYSNNFTRDMNEMSNNKNKIAIIHADGNKMGLMLQKMKKSLVSTSTKDIQNAYKDLSSQIVSATNSAVQQAFEEIFEEEINTSLTDSAFKIPFRPTIIGGDDVTVICNADKALSFTKRYLELFEKNTKDELSKLVKNYSLDDFKKGLTACAGIAYCNEKFPFHYAVDVAEALCVRAKEASKREASCLLFHNIQGSAFINFDQYISNELIIDNEKTATHLVYGPYYIRKKDNRKPLLSDFLKAYDALTHESFPTARLREWLSQLHHSPELAQHYLDRLDFIAREDSNIDTVVISETLEKLGNLSLTSLISNGRTPIHDILQLTSVQGGK